MKTQHEYIYGTTNIKLSASVCNILVTDCFNFGFVKNNLANISGFLNNIIPKLSKLRESHHNDLLKYNNNDEKITKIVESNIYNVYLKQFDLEDENQINIPFRINNNARNYFIYIEDNLLPLFDIDFTNYIRSLLKEYSIKDNIKRELCYFSEQLNDLKKSIKNNQFIKICTNEKNVYKIIPVALEQSNVRNKNYIIGYDPVDTSIIFIELADIKNISYLKEEFILSDDQVERICNHAYDILNKEEE